MLSSVNISAVCGETAFGDVGKLDDDDDDYTDNDVCAMMIVLMIVMH